MKRIVLSTIVAGLILQLAASAADEVTFPKQYPGGGDPGWKDVKKAGADPTGQVDATQIIIDILKSVNASFTIPLQVYFPAGTYLVSGTIPFQSNNECNVTFRGQGPEASIIRLKDNATGFASPKAIFITSAGNMQFKNSFYDLGINVGSGNPGAIGIDYIASNRGAIENVRIVSGDGTGEAGIAMTRQWPGPCFLRNITVEGLNYGIKVACAEYGPSFENITVKNQKVAGFLNSSNSVAIHNLVSVNTVPSLKNEGPGLAIILGGNLNSDISNASGSYLYHRDVTIKGQLQGEYKSQASKNLFPSPDKALALPIKETPEFHDNNPDNWFDANNIAAIPALDTGLRFIQNGINSGKSTLYFPMGRYGAKGTLQIPPTLKKIVGFETFLNSASEGFKRYSRYYGGDTLTLLIDQGTESDPPLIIEGFDAGFHIDHRSRRAVAIKHSHGFHYKTAPGVGDLFLEDVITFYDMQNPQRVWARQFNSETLLGAMDRITNKGGDLWIMGLKTEGKGAVINTSRGGRTEMYGTLLYPVQQFSTADWAVPAFTINEACASLIFSASSYGGAQTFYRILVSETRNGENKQMTTGMSGRVMPLFVADKGCAEPISVRRDAQSPQTLTANKAIAPRKMTRTNRVSSVTVPAGVRGFQVFSVSGELLWTCEQTPSAMAHKVAVPRRVTSAGVALVKMFRD